QTDPRPVRVPDEQDRAVRSPDVHPPIPRLDRFLCRSCWEIDEPGLRVCPRCQADLAPPLPEGARPRLVVLRGVKAGVEYPLHEGESLLGRSDEHPADVDLAEQEPPDRIWIARRHSAITWEEGVLSIQDVDGPGGTFVNRRRVHPSCKLALRDGDVLHVGNVIMKVVV